MVDLLKWQQTRSHSVFHSQSPTLRRLTGVILVGKTLVRGLKSFGKETFEPYQDQASQEGRLIAEVLVSFHIWVEPMWPQIVPIPYI